MLRINNKKENFGNMLCHCHVKTKSQMHHTTPYNRQILSFIWKGLELYFSPSELWYFQLNLVVNSLS